MSTPSEDNEQFPAVDRLESELTKSMQQLNHIQSTTDVRKIIERLENTRELHVKPIKPFAMPVVEHSGGDEVAEIYSPPRITAMAKMLGMKEGWALDLTVNDEDGEAWDFSRPEKQRRAKEQLDRNKPFMFVASPMCGPFRTLQTLFNYPKLPEEKVTEKLAEAMKHLKFTLEMCLAQHRAGRLFVFEHPAQATSWSAEMVRQCANHDGVHRVLFDFCTVGMESTDKAGKTLPAKTRTAILTNSDAIATLLRQAQCRGDHKHMVLINGLAGPCRRYPDKFSKLICEGIRRELDTIRWRNEINEVLDVTTPFGALMQVQSVIEAMAVAPEEDPLELLYQDAEFHDDVHGLPLNKKLATQARRTEIEYFRKMGVYSKVKREAWMKVITTKWIDTKRETSKTPTTGPGWLGGRSRSRSETISLLQHLPWRASGW